MSVHVPKRLAATMPPRGWLNQLRDAVAAVVSRSTPDKLQTITPRGTLIRPRPGRGGGGGTYYDLRVCRNGQQVTLRPDLERDPNLTEDE